MTRSAGRHPAGGSCAELGCLWTAGGLPRERDRRAAGNGAVPGAAAGGVVLALPGGGGGGGGYRPPVRSLQGSVWQHGHGRVGPFLFSESQVPGCGIFGEAFSSPRGLPSVEAKVMRCPLLLVRSWGGTCRMNVSSMSAALTLSREQSAQRLTAPTVCWDPCCQGPG